LVVGLTCRLSTKRKEFPGIIFGLINIKYTNMKTDVIAKELNLLRKALEEADRVRFAKGLDEASKVELEKASVVLRIRERELINEIGVEIAAQIKESSESLEELARSIRQRSARLSKTAKSTDSVTKALERVVEAVVLLKRLA
jgi:hypothetical protein